jgi:hypothetical protein
MKQILFLLVITFAVTTNFAQDDNSIKGTEKPTYTEEINSIKCVVYNNYLVKTAVIKGNGKDVNTMQAFARNAALLPKDNCLRSGIPIIAVERKEEISFVENSLLGNLLLIDLNITPDSQILLVFNLLSKKKVFENEHAEWRNGMKIQSKRYLFFEKWTEKKGLVRNCREGNKWKKQGLRVDWVQPYRLDLKTMKSVKFGASHCVSTY